MTAEWQPTRAAVAPGVVPPPASRSASRVAAAAAGARLEEVRCFRVTAWASQAASSTAASR